MFTSAIFPFHPREQPREAPAAFGRIDTFKIVADRSLEDAGLPFHPVMSLQYSEDNPMDEIITIKIPKGLRSQMVAAAKQEMFEALAELEPPFNDDLDKVKLHGCSTEKDRIEVIYRVMRGASRPDDTTDQKEDAG